MVFSVLSYTGDELRLTPSNNVEVSDSVGSEQWNLETARVSRIPGGSQRVDKLMYTFKVQRKSLFLVLNIMLPIIFIAAINILVFILPAESGERLSYSVTVLLALAVYMTLVGENLPKSSEPMSILSYYLLGTLLISTMITVVTIFNLDIYHRSGEVTQRDGSLARKIHFTSCRCKGRNTVAKVKVAFAADEKKERPLESRNDTREVTWHDVSYALDRIGLVLFTLVSLLVNTVFLIRLKYNS
ncbi:neuronal acetylcholine receptor subunit alpha-7-like [Mercenaria mercenaria]|uniref:neuronal acetylcholine receptor subunit alpha-7-like n=1 Tax=Mercenaria mercenaria TaxID=6596 RepID=UPI00234E6CD7|nr:neuronal acetylcholine receptor subunit alpha-7-like [Mercenaria mercenaria]